MASRFYRAPILGAGSRVHVRRILYTTLTRSVLLFFKTKSDTPIHPGTVSCLYHPHNRVIKFLGANVGCMSGHDQDHDVSGEGGDFGLQFKDKKLKKALLKTIGWGSRSQSAP